jgi:hypothetical protein
MEGKLKLEHEEQRGKRRRNLLSGIKPKKRASK